jgi:hypothetical protein
MVRFSILFLSLVVLSAPAAEKHRSRSSALFRPPTGASNLPKLDAAKIWVSSKNAERRGTCERRRVSVPAAPNTTRSDTPARRLPHV